MHVANQEPEVPVMISIFIEVVYLHNKPKTKGICFLICIMFELYVLNLLLMEHTVYLYFISAMGSIQRSVSQHQTGDASIGRAPNLSPDGSPRELRAG